MSDELTCNLQLALRTELPHSSLDEFWERLEELLWRGSDHRSARFISQKECKWLVRHQCRRYDELTGSDIFGQGAYFPIFASFHERDPSRRQLLLRALEAFFELSVDLDDPVSSAAAVSSRVIRTWGRLARRGTPLDPSPATQLMLWRVFESIVKGEVEVVEVRQGDRLWHYPRFASSPMLVQRRKDARRAEVLSSLKFTLGCASLRRPPLVKLLERDELLTAEARELILAAVSSRDPSTAEPIAALLRHHIELIALGDYPQLEVFTDLITDFLTHLRGDVLPVGKAPENAMMRRYLQVLQERYLPGLFNYARILRKARLGSPFLGDLLQESYLVRTRSMDGDQEPSFGRLLQDWVAAQRVIQTRAGYRSTKGFSFVDAYLEDAAPVPQGVRGRTERGFAVKELADFDTFLELPAEARVADTWGSVTAEGNPREGAGFDDGDVDETARTTPYQRVRSLELRSPTPSQDGSGALPPIAGPPPEGPKVFPVRLGSMDNLYSAPTEIIPALTDDAMDLHTAVTEILPTNTDGTVDLQRVATQLFPTSPQGGADEE